MRWDMKKLFLRRAEFGPLWEPWEVDEIGRNSSELWLTVSQFIERPSAPLNCKIRLLRISFWSFHYSKRALRRWRVFRYRCKSMEEYIFLLGILFLDTRQVKARKRKFVKSQTRIKQRSQKIRLFKLNVIVATGALKLIWKSVEENRKRPPSYGNQISNLSPFEVTFLIFICCAL